MKEFFESVLNSDTNPIVICNTEHEIIYMNCASIKAYGNLIGSSILRCHNKKSNEQIIKVTDWFKISKENNRIHTFYNAKQNKDVYMIAIRDTEGNLIGYYEKHELRTKDDLPFYGMKIKNDEENQK